MLAADDLVSPAPISSRCARSVARGLASGLLGTLLALWSHNARAATTLSADIAPQPVADALAEFAHQTRLQFIYVSKIVKARQSKGAHAGLVPAEALPSLLEGTGLSFQFLNERTVRIFETAATASAPSNAAGAPKPGSGNRAPWSERGDEEIIVTGLHSVDDPRIAEDVQRIAASVSMVSGDRLEAQKLGQLSDYAAYLPGLNLDLGGVPGFIDVQLRGIVTFNDTASLIYYIDDTPIGPIGMPAGAPDLIPYDLERLEVQRGPQGTLGGAGSETGLIRYVLREPSLSGFEAHVGVDASATHYAAKSGSSFQAMANVPIISDVLAVRVSGYDSYTPGFIDNAYSGAKDVNVQRRHGGRITALWRPAESLAVKVTALWNRIDADSSDLVISTGAATAVDAGDANIYKVSKSWGQYTQDYAFLPSYQADHTLYAATLHWNPGSIDIFSTTSWSRYQRHIVADTSGNTGSSFPDLSGGTIPAGLANQQNDTDLEKFSDELRISSPQGGRIEWLLGGFYTYEGVTDRLGEYAFDNGYQPIAFFAPAIWFQVVPSTFRKLALFGDLTWRASDRFDLTGGIRFDHNDQSFSAIVDGSTITVPESLSGQYSEGVTTWATTARYHFTPDVMLYGHVATGSQPGSTNGPGYPPVKAERLINYEMGLKSEFLDRRGMINLTVFYIDWRDIQLSTHDFVNGFSWVNGGTAVSQGAELASSWSPVHALRFGYNAAYTQAELTELDPDVQYYMTGYQLPQVPRWSMSFTADYDWALMDLWHAHLGGACRWTGPLWTYVVQSRSHDGVPTAELPGYSLLDLNASIAKGPLALRAYARNLADIRASRHGHLSVDPSGTIANTDDYMVLPRTIGIGIDYSF